MRGNRCESPSSVQTLLGSAACASSASRAFNTFHSAPGCWKLDKATTAQSVYDAIVTGYRHIDSACDYGNEVEVGAGIARAISEGIVTRAELWVTSKLWCTFHRPERVEEAVTRTLSDLGLAYLDVRALHRGGCSLRWIART